MKIEILKSNKRIQCNIIFLIVAIYQIFQQSLVWLYHDDYGYACLHYGTDVGTTGLNYGLVDMLRYFKWHYFNWGGRILYFFAMVVLLRVGGLWLIRIVQTILVIGIMYETYLLVRRKGQDSPFLACTSVLLYGMFSIVVAKDGIYWYIASVAYTWPFFFFLLGLLIQEKVLNIKGKKLYSVITFIVFFIAGFSHEQVAVLVMTYQVLRAGWKKHAGEVMNWSGLMGAVIGGMLQLLAPGNFVRAETAAGEVLSLPLFFAKIIQNSINVIKRNFGGGNVFVCALLCAMVIMAVTLMYKETKAVCKKKLLLVLVALNIVYPALNVVNILTGAIGNVLDVMVVLWMIETFAVLFVYAVKYKDTELFIILIACMASQAMMVFAPAVNYRSAIVAQYMLHICALMVLVRFIKTVNCGKAGRKLFVIGYAAYAIASVVNMAGITYGYYQNNAIHKENDALLREAASQVKDGKTVDSVVFHRVKYTWCSGDMPYMENREYIEYWIREYYELPQNVRFEYR